MGVNVRQITEWVQDQLDQSGVYFGHGTDNATDEAVALVFHVLSIHFPGPNEVWDRVISHAEQTAIQTLLHKRIDTQKPLPYLTHTAYFAGLPFYVDERVLIPRSPIAELIAQQFVPWVQPDFVSRILDLCTGSGCMAVACAKVFPEAKVVASDISEEALSVAAINIQKHDVSDRVQCVHSDLFQNLPNQQFDIIVSNPPYVSAVEMQTLPAEYYHEPTMALKSDDGGLQIVTNILKQAADYLTDNGVLIVEVGASGGQALLEERYPRVSFVWLEFERGGEGVFLLDKAALLALES